MKSEFKNKETVQTKKTCYFCKKSGHFKSECMKYKSWKNKKEKSKKVTENVPTLSLRNLKKHATKRGLLTRV